MTDKTSFDRESYLMMLRGLEQMAVLYKRANTPSPASRLKQLVLQEGFASLPLLLRKLFMRCRDRASVWLRRRRTLFRRSGHRLGEYFRLVRQDRSVTEIHGGVAVPSPGELSYPAERYFRNGRIAVYTALFGNYDHMLQPMIRPDNIDYFILTDREFSDGGAWQYLDPARFVPAEFRRDPILCNRWCKMHPHLLFPEYDVSLYLDSNLLVVSDLTPLVTALDHFPVAMFRHWKRDCVYREVQACLDARRDTRENLKRHEERLRDQKIPEGWGLLEAPVIARQHHEARCISLMEHWWDNFLSGSRRDQLSLIETLWQQGIEPEQIGTLGPNLYRCNLFVKTTHRKKVTYH